MKLETRKYLLVTILVVMFTIGSVMDLWLYLLCLSRSPNLKHYRAMLARRWWSWTMFSVGQVVNFKVKMHGDKMIPEGNMLIISEIPMMWSTRHEILTQVIIYQDTTI